MSHRIIGILDRVLPPTRRRRLRRPAPVGALRQLALVSERWGTDRGQPIDRYYIDRFLLACESDIHGAVVEIKDRGYTERFGSRVTRSDVLDVDSSNHRATIVADLTDASTLPEAAFDCAIVTQTLQYIFDLEVAVRNLHRMLRPGGVLLVSVPAVSMVGDGAGLRDYWHMTENACSALFSRSFGAENVTTAAYGNVLAALAFLVGMAREELRQRELDAVEPRFPVVVCVRAVKAQADRVM